MNACELLTLVDETLDSPERWTKGAYGKDAHGDLISVDAAERTCLVGTLRKVQLVHRDEVDYPVYHRCLKVLSDVVEKRASHRSLPTYNDRAETTFEDIKSLIAEGKKAVCTA